MKKYDSAERLNIYATDSAGKRAIAWAKKRWRTWDCGEHEPPKSASTLLRDLLIHAMEADKKKRLR